MNINTQEINGFIIETFNQHNLEEGKKQGIVPCVHLRENLKIKSLNVLPMIGTED